MCGIAGRIGGDPGQGRAAMERMVRTLRHRGPDHQAVEDVGGGATLGHARLSIIDLAARSNQPMRDRTGRYALSYNGEVYNFAEIRMELEKLGHTFDTRSDTEVVLHAVMEWGTSALVRFNGMFALALWDAREHELLLARDRFGKKPLYYTQLGGCLTFASELTPLLEDDLIRERASLSVEALNHYYAIGYILTPLSIAQGIFKLPPASFLRYRDGAVIETARYWNYSDAFRRSSKGSLDDLAHALAGHLETAVRRRLVSDVPVGSFLSGGLDSSGVAAFAKNAIGYALHTFSIGFTAPSYDESAEARSVAQALGTVHHERLLRLEDGPALIDSAIACYDEPFSDTSLVPMVEVSRVAAGHVKVVLSGDGADELMAGYPTYRADALKRTMDLFPVPVRQVMGRTIPLIVPKGRRKTGIGFRARQFARGLPLDFRRAHYGWRELHSVAERIALMGAEHADLIRDTDPTHVFARHYDEVADLDPLSQHLYVDAKTWLVDDILVKLDRATMASSIEARTPFLDADLVEFLASLPPEMKLKGGLGKVILRRALAPYLPERVLRRPKAGFNAPINYWFRSHAENEFRAFNKYVASRWSGRLQIAALRRDDVVGHPVGAQLS
jgi:asparagine synthase (glutamine-hydrolysing)